jgi:hypothetical protein
MNPVLLCNLLLIFAAVVAAMFAVVSLYVDAKQASSSMSDFEKRLLLQSKASYRQIESLLK